jgi:hypothetical protein
MSGTTVKDYDTSTLSDTQLAKKAQEELNMEGEMEEVRSILLLRLFVIVNLDCYLDCINCIAL